MREGVVAGDLLVEASGLEVSFGAVTALAGVDLAVRAGEIVTLIGPNGSGKTTLVKVILGLLEPAQGTVYRRPGLRLGYMPQRIAIDPTLPLNVRRFLDLAYPRGRKRRLAELKAALDEVGAGQVLESPLHGISGGELQRVMLARTLIRDPDLLVLDEPVQGVDVGSQSELYRLIASLRDRRGCGILLVSHDLHVVMAATDRVVCLNQHVCCTGTPEAVSREPGFVSLFGPDVASSLAVYSHHHNHRHDAHGRVLPLDEGARRG